MFRNHTHHFSNSLHLADILFIGLSILLLGNYWPTASNPHQLQFPVAACLAMLVWPMLSWRRKVYASMRTKPLFKETPRLLKTVLLTFGLTSFITIIFFGLTREEGTALAMAALVATVAMSLIRISFRLFFKSLRKLGCNNRNYILLGQSMDSQEVIRTFEENPQSGVNILGFFSFFKDRKNAITEVPYLGSVVGLGDFLERNVVDEVILTPGPTVSLGQVNQAIKTAQELGVVTRLMPQTFTPANCRIHVDQLFEFPTITWFNGPSPCTAMVLKKMTDTIIAGLSCILLAPVFVTIALLVKLSSKGPVFFRQTRCGLHGRTFQALKFRTMVRNAEALKMSLMDRNEEDGPAFKIKRDPRITPIGRILRKFSLDELPQLFNILAGDMSLVGPRPPIPAEVSQYNHWQRRRLSVTPGITCIWQVKGRNRVSFDEWMKMDLEYIDNWSLMLDMRLLLLTVPAVVRGTGA